MRFYESFVRLCNQAGEKPSAVAKKVGFSESTASRWSRGMVPTYSNLIRIADYFGITVGELVGATPENVNELADYYGVSADLLIEDNIIGVKAKGDVEIDEYLEDLRTRPATRMLLAATRGMTQEQIEIMANFAKTIRSDGK